jgi:hypothetical protein
MFMGYRDIVISRFSYRYVAVKLSLYRGKMVIAVTMGSGAFLLDR